VQLQRRLNREGGGRNLCVVQYEQLLAEPFACMRDIYSKLEIPMTDEAMSRAANYLRQSKQHTHGRPLKVAVSEVGLSREQIVSDFSEYCKELLREPPADGAAPTARC
jgi:hypothetical protein